MTASPLNVPTLLQSLGITTEQPNSGCFDGKKWEASGNIIESTNPSTGDTLALIQQASPPNVDRVLKAAKEASLIWRKVPAPERGRVLRLIKDALEAKVDDLGMLITLEMGKIISEGRGEVVEFLDVADVAVGLSRSIGGMNIPSERKGHFMTEVCHPLGVVGVISAFNFPVAVFGWNFALALITGNATVWKPSETTPLCALATVKIIQSVLESQGYPGALCSLLIGGAEVGKAMVEAKEVDLISFTGSEKVGRLVGMECASRFKQSILELGGNNCAIVMPDANIEVALGSILFAAIGTAGQRCTTTRRLLVHSSIADIFLSRLTTAYKSVSGRTGLPYEASTLVGPVHSQAAVKAFEKAVECAKREGGEVLFGGGKVEGRKEGNWVVPTLIRYKTFDGVEIVKKETFVPILHVTTFDTLPEAIALNNSVSQGLSSALYTQDIANVFEWIGPNGTDCGVVNVNGSTSGAEVGGRFGGNKSTGWGRECGGEAWKQYCRWSTCTVNFSGQVGMAQGVKFE